jgi:hypothetical protein
MSRGHTALCTWKNWTRPQSPTSRDEVPNVNSALSSLRFKAVLREDFSGHSICGCTSVATLSLPLPFPLQLLLPLVKLILSVVALPVGCMQELPVPGTQEALDQSFLSELWMRGWLDGVTDPWTETSMVPMGLQSWSYFLICLPIFLLGPFLQVNVIWSN